MNCLFPLDRILSQTLSIILLLLSLAAPPIALAQNPQIPEAYEAARIKAEKVFQQLSDNFFKQYPEVAHKRFRSLGLTTPTTQLVWGQGRSPKVNRRNRIEYPIQWIKQNPEAIDVFRISVCHELGHILTKMDLASEDFADYFSTLKCMRFLLAEEPNEAYLKQTKIPSLIEANCRTGFSDLNDQLICMRSAIAGLEFITAADNELKTVTFPGFISSAQKIDLETIKTRGNERAKTDFWSIQTQLFQLMDFDLGEKPSSASAQKSKVLSAYEVVSKKIYQPLQLTIDPIPYEKTFQDSYSTSNCRLQSFLQGAFCSVSHLDSLSPHSPTVGICNSKEGYSLGNPPSCWWKD